MPVTTGLHNDGDFVGVSVLYDVTEGLHLSLKHN